MSLYNKSVSEPGVGHQPIRTDVVPSALSGLTPLISVPSSPATRSHLIISLASLRQLSSPSFSSPPPPPPPPQLSDNYHSIALSHSHYWLTMQNTIIIAKIIAKSWCIFLASNYITILHMIVQHLGWSWLLIWHVVTSIFLVFSNRREGARVWQLHHWGETEIPTSSPGNTSHHPPSPSPWSTPSPWSPPSSPSSPAAWQRATTASSQPSTRCVSTRWDCRLGSGPIENIGRILWK